jgi:hypothetical protein
MKGDPGSAQHTCVSSVVCLSVISPPIRGTMTLVHVSGLLPGCTASVYGHHALVIILVLPLVFKMNFTFQIPLSWSYSKIASTTLLSRGSSTPIQDGRSLACLVKTSQLSPFLLWHIRPLWTQTLRKSHNECSTANSFLGCCAVWIWAMLPKFRRYVLPPCSKWTQEEINSNN